MRSSFTLGILINFPIVFWLLLNIYSTPFPDDLTLYTEPAFQALILLLAGVITIALPWVKRTDSLTHKLSFILALIACSFPFAAVAWLSSQLGVTKIIFDYILLLIYSCVLLGAFYGIELTTLAAYIKQYLRISLQIALIGVVFIYKETWFLWNI